MTSEADNCVAPLDNLLAASSLNTSFFAFKGLKDYGYGELANAMRHNLLQWVTNETAPIREYYNPVTGEGLAAVAFGWSAAFTISFILDWDNDNLTWLFQNPPTQ